MEENHKMYFKIDGLIVKQTFPEEFDGKGEYDKLMDQILDLIYESGYSFGGTMGEISEEEFKRYINDKE